MTNMSAHNLWSDLDGAASTITDPFIDAITNPVGQPRRLTYEHLTNMFASFDLLAGTGRNPPLPILEPYHIGYRPKLPLPRLRRCCGSRESQGRVKRGLTNEFSFVLPTGADVEDPHDPVLTGSAGHPPGRSDDAMSVTQLHRDGFFGLSPNRVIWRQR